MDINFHGLTRETYALRWSQLLTGNGRVWLVVEAFEDCSLKRPDEISLFQRLGYDEMCKKLFGYDQELMQEIHDRMAGQRRRNGKNPIYSTQHLLAFVPPDQFVSSDDKESA